MRPMTPEAARRGVSATASAMLQQGAAFREERIARRGKRDPPVGSVEQLRADVAFELTDRLGERRLRHPQPLRRPAEVEFLGDGDEVAGGAEIKH